MSFRLRSYAAILVLLCFLPAVHAQSAGGKDTKSPASGIQKKSYHFKEADKDMTYGLFVPSGYEAGKKMPLIVALHGLGSNPQQILRYRGLTDLAQKHGYIVVAPMGYNERGWYGAKPPGRRKTEPENLAELSEKDVMNVLEIVRKEYTIDPDRIFLMGHSMGGGGTMHLAIKYPDIWAGLAPIAPALFRPATDLEKIKHIPVIMVQGDNDQMVRVGTVRPWAEQMKKLGMNYEYLEVPGGDHIRVAFDKMPQIFEFFNKQKRSDRPAK